MARYQLTAWRDGHSIDHREVYARDREHLKNLKDELRDRMSILSGKVKVTAKKVGK